jgi:hypothetical protein
LEGFDGVYVLEPSPPIIKDRPESSILLSKKLKEKCHEGTK